MAGTYLKEGLYLTEKEAADKSGMSIHSFRSANVPFERFGYVKLFNWSDVEQYLAIHHRDKAKPQTGKECTAKPERFGFSLLIDYMSPFVLFDSRGRKFCFDNAEQAMESSGLNRTEFTFMITKGRTVKGWTGVQG